MRPNFEDFRRLLVNLLTLASYSYDGADQGFLTAEFRELEKAPLFVPARYVSAGGGRPAELPLMRIPMEYNANSVFWYPHFTWDYYRRVPKKQRMCSCILHACACICIRMRA